MTHWATTYLGKSWSAGESGPDAYDCWGLFRQVQAAHYGREVPLVPEVDVGDILAVARAMRDHDERGRWREVPQPADGDGVLMAHARYPSHVGVWIDVGGGGVLHAVSGAGVIFSSLSSLRLAGWGRILFYRAAS